METNRINKILILLFTSVLFISCKSSLSKSINDNYLYEYTEEGFSNNYANCIRVSRKALLDLLLEKNIVKNQRVFIIEIYNPQMNSLEAKIICDRFNYSYQRKNYEKCQNVKRWYPGENYDHDYFDYIVQMAKENRYTELTILYKDYPISNTGLIYLTVIDLEKARISIV